MAEKITKVLQEVVSPLLGFVNGAGFHDDLFFLFIAHQQAENQAVSRNGLSARYCFFLQRAP